MKCYDLVAIWSVCIKKVTTETPLYSGFEMSVFTNIKPCAMSIRPQIINVQGKEGEIHECTGIEDAYRWDCGINCSRWRAQREKVEKLENEIRRERKNEREKVSKTERKKEREREREQRLMSLEITSCPWTAYSRHKRFITMLILYSTRY